MLYVEILEVKPNKMFTEEQRQSIRFLRYNGKISCAECGKKGKVMWTMLCEFEAKTFEKDIIEKSGKVHQPLTPVCKEHPLLPNMPADRG